jgi:hypothetical protein
MLAGGIPVIPFVVILADFPDILHQLVQLTPIQPYPFAGGANVDKNAVFLYFFHARAFANRAIHHYSSFFIPISPVVRRRCTVGFFYFLTTVCRETKYTELHDKG